MNTPPTLPNESLAGSSAEAQLSRFVWETRYRNPPEQCIEETWRRVASAAAAAEGDPQLWRERFFNLLKDFRFLPAGRILAGAATQRQVTLFNCFVMGSPEDSLTGIFDALKEGALTMQQGGGVGYDFSTLRPRGSHARTTGMVASGPVSFLHVWDAMCATILSTGARRGAMMATLRCDHPDIEEFIDAKRAPDALKHFNLSVLISDAFMRAVEADEPWALVFPDRELQERSDPQARCLERAWSGNKLPVTCRIYKTVRARDLWLRLCRSAHECAEPGVLFIDRINALNNLAYCETLSATNPCGEVPLPPYGACNLGSLNLTQFVRDAFTPQAVLDEKSIRETARLAVRFLDDVIEISHFPLQAQREQAYRSRRIGLGITGLADMLAMLTVRYDSAGARDTAARVMQWIRDAAYEASVELALEKGAFPAFRAPQYLERPFIQALSQSIREGIGRHGTRNSHLLAIAPTGSISLLAHNVSSGIEPIFGLETLRRVLGADGMYRNFQATNYAYAMWRAQQADAVALPDYFIDGMNLAPREHVLMQAALQPYVDSSISKTIPLPRDFPAAGVQDLFKLAFDSGVKGCTIYREQRSRFPEQPIDT